MPRVINRRRSRLRRRRDHYPSIERLTAGQEAEVLFFLESRPLHTVFLRGFILDNGLENKLNRGSFYGYRNPGGLLEGVALIGHATLFETRLESAIRAFAFLAREESIHMILGEQGTVQIFWQSLREARPMAPRMCSELLFAQRLPVKGAVKADGLRRATIDDLDRVMPIQAEMAFAESGVNPMISDPLGFRRRCSRRIELGRVWVCVEENKLTFKAEVMSQTPDVAYLEGVYVDPAYRGNGHGLKCLSQMGGELAQSTKSVCLFANEHATDAQQFYQRAGFALTGVYSTIFPGG